jgi:hypothetical protein
MNIDCEAFYRERDDRSVEYMGPIDWAGLPIGIAIDEATASSRAGQVALLALVNMAARLHRHILVAVPDVPLIARSLVPADDLRHAVVATAQAIDPCGRLDLVDHRSMKTIASVGIGPVRGGTCQAYVGVDGLLATLATGPQPFEASDASILGAALASCMAAAALVGMVTGHPIVPTRLSLWRLGDGVMAEPGPSDVAHPLDIGDVLVVGAGAVASALLYWLRELGVTGRWVVVDGDLLELPNTNRSIGTLVAETGWLGGAAEPKAIGASRLIGADARVAWYDQWLGSEPAWTPAVVLPLANGRDVRSLISLRGEERIVHATTSRDWTAELHRHVADVDGCIVDRLPDRPGAAPFICSTGTLTSATGMVTDAALPFLSAAAGLMLVRALTMGAEEFDALPANHWRLHLGPPGSAPLRFSRLIWPPHAGCQHILSTAARRRARAGQASSPA